MKQYILQIDINLFTNYIFIGTALNFYILLIQSELLCVVLPVSIILSNITQSILVEKRTTICYHFEIGLLIHLLELFQN